MVLGAVVIGYATCMLQQGFGPSSPKLVRLLQLHNQNDIVIVNNGFFASLSKLVCESFSKRMIYFLSSSPGFVSINKILLFL